MAFTSVEESIGLGRAAKLADMPVVIAFFVARGGRLTGREKLEEALSRVDSSTGKAPAYQMINCTHATEFEPALYPGSGPAVLAAPCRTRWPWRRWT